MTERTGFITPPPQRTSPLREDQNSMFEPIERVATSALSTPIQASPSGIEVTSVSSADDHVSTVSSPTLSDDLFTLSPSPRIEEDEQNNPIQHPPTTTLISLPEIPKEPLHWVQNELEQMKREIAQIKKKAEELEASMKLQSQISTRKSTTPETNNQELTGRALTRALMEQAKKSLEEAKMISADSKAAISRIFNGCEVQKSH